jgi:SAM-dependent methyltransferase
MTALGAQSHGDLSPRFLALIEEEGLGGRRVLDVGSGWGRLALALAPRARWVVGIEREAALVAEARARARAAGFRNVEFHQADADREDYARFAPDLVVAHLYGSGALIERAGRALAPGGCLAVACLHVDQWRESGRPSRFAWDEARMAATLEEHGLTPEVLEVEREERRFASVEEALAAVTGLEARWRADGRWERYRPFLAGGGRTLTRSHLLVKARRR